MSGLTRMFLAVSVILPSVLFAQYNSNDNANDNSSGETCPPGDPMECCCDDGCQPAVFQCLQGWTCPEGSGCALVEAPCGPENCPIVGACCLGSPASLDPTASCDDTKPEELCEGVYMGNGVLCGEERICCDARGNATCESEECCSGTALSNLDCDDTTTSGCCCNAVDSGTNNASEECCEATQGNIFLPNTSCGAEGACCLPTGCEQLAEQCCIAAGGTFAGPASACSSTSGACCTGPGQLDCYQTTTECCTEQVYGDPTTFYEGAPCPEACDYANTGACCHGDGTCTQQDSSTCNGVFQGIGTLCVDYEPQITVQPQDTTVCEGSDATFTVHASTPANTGTLHYQWYRTDPQGNVTPTCSDSPTCTWPLVDQVPDDGSKFHCEVKNDCGTVSSEQATLTVVRVVSVEWKELAAYSTPLDTCPNNGDKRMYPGRAEYDDAHAADRNKVTLVATISPAAEDITVYFKNFDIDDPFDQNNPTMPDVGVIDNDTSGPDNRPAGQPDPGIGNWTATTDANGTATITIATSMKPGNNYRAVASCNSEHIDQIDQQAADEQSIPGNASVSYSEMLTLWRTVWLELDSMGPGSDITLSGTVDSIRPVNDLLHPDEYIVMLRDPNPASLVDEHRFEGGTLTIQSDSYRVMEQKRVFNLESVVVKGKPPNSAIGRIATLIDDDTTQLPILPNADTDVIDSLYSGCFLSFVHVAAQYQDLNNTFQASIPPNGILVLKAGMENADLSPAPDFWWVLIVSAYQRRDDDADPNERFHLHGDSALIGHENTPYATTPMGLSNGENRFSNTVVVWQENMRDHLQGATQLAIELINAGVPEDKIFERLGGGPPASVEWTEPRAIAHEIGHTLGLLHKDDTLMSPTDEPARVELQLDAHQVNAVRSSDTLNQLW